MLVTCIRWISVDATGAADVLTLTEIGGDNTAVTFSSPYFPTLTENAGEDEHPNMLFEGGFKAQITTGTVSTSVVRVYFRLIKKAGVNVF
jgi:hypothetical protein